MAKRSSPTVPAHVTAAPSECYAMNPSAKGFPIQRFTDCSVNHFHVLFDSARTSSIRLSSSRPFAFIFFAVIYIWPSVARARRKLLWDDEFFTLYLSRTKSWNDLLAALATGADQHPPSFYYLTHLIFNFAGTTHLTLRLTAIVGFGAACLCLWEIVSLTVNRTWSMAAMSLPLRSSSYY
jgi:hypothetical protein